VVMCSKRPTEQASETFRMELTFDLMDVLDISGRVWPAPAPP
jgi:hypothetical protein